MAYLKLEPIMSMRNGIDRAIRRGHCGIREHSFAAPQLDTRARQHMVHRGERSEKNDARRVCANRREYVERAWLERHRPYVEHLHRCPEWSFSF